MNRDSVSLCRTEAQYLKLGSKWVSNLQWTYIYCCVLEIRMIQKYTISLRVLIGLEVITTLECIVFSPSDTISFRQLKGVFIVRKWNSELIMTSSQQFLIHVYATRQKKPRIWKKWLKYMKIYIHIHIFFYFQLYIKSTHYTYIYIFM